MKATTFPDLFGIKANGIGNDCASLGSLERRLVSSIGSEKFGTPRGIEKRGSSRLLELLSLTI